jgi:hypothetical protein
MKTFALSFASLLLSNAAFANPIMIVQELSAQVVAGPHVKLTYTHNYGSSDVTTHGTTHSPWVSAGSIARDTGSGVKDLPILRMCDCHVPTGSTLDYRIGTGSMSPASTTQVSVPEQGDLDKVTGDDCKLPCQQADADAVDAGQIDGTGGATGAGGATAAGGATSAGGATAAGGATSTGGATAAGGATGAGGATAAGGTTSAGGATAAGGATGAGGATAAGGATGTTDKPKGSGCALVGPGTPSAMVCLALLGFVIAARRRRL